MFKFFEKSSVKISIAFIMLLSCLIEITEELGFHALEEFGSHHGLAIFAISHVMIALGHATEAAKTIDENV
mgnify:CR=1 FL=1